MRDLAFHYESICKLHPHDRLIIIFDIDGTILDTRYMIISILHAYDRENGTHHFRYLVADDIHIHENEIEALLDNLGITDPEKSKIVEWYAVNFWSENAVLQSHQPFHGVLDVIRWFQLQPNTLIQADQNTSGMRHYEFSIHLGQNIVLNSPPSFYR